jgi:hypothetical protein
VDPFLFAHKRTNVPLFDLTVGLRTISIRDQMTRALLLAERLPAWLEEQLGLEHQHPVLVVGGGACGMTAAVALAWKGLTVEVAERDGHLFNLQRNCTSRWLDPTQYDWPLDIWRTPRFPLKRSHLRTPFGWNPNFAQGIARKWGQQLTRHLRRGMALTMRRGLEAYLRHAYNATTRLLRVQFNNPQTGHAVGRKNYGAVIWAFGQGNEQCDLANSPQFRGLSFWHTDQLEDDHCGLATQADEGTVLISGSSDGALQDFLRVVTRRRSVRDIYDYLQLNNAGIDVHKILSAELRAERALNWSTGARYAASYLRELQDCHEQVVLAILAAPGLQARIQNLLARRPQRTVLVTRQDHFTCLYPLNRFLTLLILEGFKHASLDWRAGFEVHRVQNVGMPPAILNPTNCIGRPWRVELHPVQAGAAQHVDANVVLLRHGMESLETSLPPGATLPRMPRPIPPVHLF